MNKRKEYTKKYFQEHKAEFRERHRKWRKKNRKRFNELNRLSAKRWREKNPEESVRRAREHIIKVRDLVLFYYGGNPPKCLCCKEDKKEFLCIDHIDGVGNKQRKALKTGGGYAFYPWLIKSNYPVGFRVLCHNCNMSLGFNGYCPHNNL